MRLTGSTTATYSLFRKSDGIEKIRLLRLFARKLPLADFCTNICQVGWCRIHRPLQTDVEQISLGSNREDSQSFVNERVCRH